MADIERRIEDLIARMTLEEKLAQLGSCWVHELESSGELEAAKLLEKLRHGIGQITRVAGESGRDPVSAAHAGNQIQRYLVEETRLGIPAILHEESCSGAMIQGGSSFPQVIGLASTFQPELAERMTAVIRSQLLAIGARQSLAPVLDVARDPRWGRIEETFGEDPTLVSQFGMAYIRGLQGEDLSRGVLATGKHFIAHSQSQGGENCAPVSIGQRELFNIFLAPFQAAIRDAHLASIMNSYPELDSEVVACSRRILTDLLRGQLGFEGMVVSDYEAIAMIHTFHHAADNPGTAGRLALKAGIDVELPTVYGYGEVLRSALEKGELELETIHTALRRSLRKKFELGLFENPFVDESRVMEVFETNEQRHLAEEIALQSMVLLKNDGMLPLRKDLPSLAVIGPNADDSRNQLGDYSFAAVKELMTLVAPSGLSFGIMGEAGASDKDPKVITLLEGILESVSPNTRILAAKGCEVTGEERSGFQKAVDAALASEAVILVLGDRSGLTPGCTSGETRDSATLRLPGVQEDLAKAILATGKPVAVVLVSGRPYALPWLDEHANAILEAWLPGEEGGRAVAKVLFGEHNPAGRLPVTFPRHVGQVPIYYNHKPSGMKSHWYGDYTDEKAEPLYPFGHGLSYSSFEYRDLTISKQEVRQGELIEVSLQVANVGSRAGDEVVQLYIQDEIASSPRPVKELKGFCRLPLEAGNIKQVTFHLPVDQLAFYDLDLNLILEPGGMLVMVGSSSEDIRLRGHFIIQGEAKIPVASRVFSCPVSVD